MPNKTYALEWLAFSKKNLLTAQLLFDAKHYEDIIGIEIQQSLEKLLKAIAAYENIKISRDHDLVKLYFVIEDNYIKLEEEEILLLKIATDYYKEDRYPNPNYCLPTREEVGKVLRFAEGLLVKTCQHLHIEPSEIL